MARFQTIAQILAFLILASFLVWFGASIPVHFKAVSPSVITAAGENTENMEERASLFLELGKTGPTHLLWQADEALPANHAQADRLRNLLAKHSHYSFSGGPAPYFEKFLSLIPQTSPKVATAGVMGLLIPRAHREALHDFLGESSNATVKTLLETRHLTGITRFMPVTSPAGQPLEATILTTALLIQGNHFSPEFLKQLKTISSEALAGELYSIEKLEDFYLSLLTLGKRLNWLQLTELTTLAKTPESLKETASLTRQFPERLPFLYALCLFSQDLKQTTRYLQRFGEEGWGDLSFALQQREGGLQKILREQKPLYNPSALGWIGEKAPTWQREFLAGLTHKHPKPAFILKFLSFLLAGYFLALGLGKGLKGISSQKATQAQSPYLFAIVYTSSSFIFGSLVWVLMEPSLLEFGPKAKATLRLVFNASSNLVSLKSQKLAPSMLDQITVITLSVFFLIQLVVYIACLFKVSEIHKQSQRASLKIKLLENEETLFDLGLYVGLGGTVASLIMLAMDIVQASLIAAYSSTLLGIIFVAILKIFHVRPLRRTLILELQTEHESNASTHNL